ncbi:hypothetical protein N7456_011378 [Penicillium angulare]|uniref:Xylanolytic transcriptional activator regulatory domain-containing protein n=1 Tax=Penicillium angulare TaxID=116970 RepID=A0A9W9ETJ9_9EURO|nr:hypothetical protein N7456_011378 [Penicillium angulare]
MLVNSAIKCVIVGDSGIGKTSLLISYTTKEFPPRDAPVLLDPFEIDIMLKGEKHTLGLWDTTFEQGYTRLSPIWYPKTNIFLLCFSIASPSSFDNITEKWLPEVRHACPNAPCLVVGTKTDLRNDTETIHGLLNCNAKPLQYQEGVKMAKSLGLHVPQPAPQIQTVTPSTRTLVSPVEDSPSENENYGRGTGLVSLQNSLTPFAGSHDGHSHRSFAYLTRTSICTPTQPYPITPAAIAQGVEVLRSILDFNADFPEVARDQGETGAIESCGSFLFRAAWRATQSTLRKLEPRPSLDQLTSATLAIFEQTALPLQLPLSAENNAIEEALSDKLLRWETVSMCFIRIIYFSATLRTNTHGSHGRAPPSFNYQKTMRLAFESCMQTRAFCDQVDQTNDLTVWILTSLISPATWCFGDDSLRVWRIMGDVASVITALGFHKGFSGNTSDPPYLIELRKRVIALAHEHDKELSTFVGRPPRLNQKYFTFDLPLDLPDSIITGPVEQFEAAKANLDKNGWSHEVMVHPASRLRALLLLSSVREGVLELSLGLTEKNIAEEARKLLAELGSAWDKIPHKPYEQLLSGALSANAMWVVVGSWFKFLYTEFLLHKLLISQNEGNRDKMIRISHAILQLALSLFKKNDVISTPNLEAIMVFYAMPCACILILELFRQSRQGPSAAVLNRSTIIQDISVLISCCDSVAIFGQSNYQMCKQAQAVFKRCLDQILDPAALPSNSHDLICESGTEVQDPQAISLGSVDFGLTDLYPNDPDWSVWLESFDLYETLS